ncbi:MAG TPA: hypothetical protein VN711_03755 [Candidatus Saccharimonadales bacterium]|nr:hypothetical protein [Candidatus Saccharimonadales bacterium]
MVKKFFLLFFFILLLAFSLRVVFLDRVPTAVSNDEIDYLLNAKSVFLSGSDISHTWNPFTFTPPKSSFPQAEIAPLMTFWLIGPLPLSLLTSKLIYVLFSTGIVGLLYLITKKLIGENEAYLVGLVAACNPWLIFFGRSAYDTSLAIFFFLLACYLALILKGWKIVWVFPILFSAFYSYIGTKLLFLPFTLIIFTFAWYQNKKYAKQYTAVFALCLILFSYYVFSVLHTPGARLNELATPQLSSITATVDTERRLSIHSPLTIVFSNKYVVFGKYALDKYMNTFSPNFLFLHGDEKAQFTLWNQGVFYYLDAFFLLVGFAVLFRKNKKVLLLLSGIVLIAPIPSVLSTVGNSYAIRSLLLAPLFIIFIGVGIWYVISKYRFSWIPIAAIYTLLLLNFFNIYFLQDPLYNSESFSFSGRELAHYLSLQKGSVYVINANPKTPYKQYMFYNNWLNKSTQDKAANDYRAGTFSIGTSHFITCNRINTIQKGSTVLYDDSCKKFSFSKGNEAIAQLGDGGTIYTIQNDKVCSKYSLSLYPHDITFSDLSVESLSQEEFCEKFITRF